MTQPQIAIFEPEHKRAWWTFDFSSVVPESGMNSETFLVSVFWQVRSPAVGYSRYNRPCDEIGPIMVMVLGGFSIARVDSSRRLETTAITPCFE